MEPVVEGFADRRGLQGRFDEDGSADALRRKRKRHADEGSDEDDDSGDDPDEDEDGDMTPSGP